jgi:hypothetical protein
MSPVVWILLEIVAILCGSWATYEGLWGKQRSYTLSISAAIMVAGNAYFLVRDIIALAG